MKVQRDKIRQYQKKIVVVTARETEVAKQCLAQGNKPRALLALRRKKYQESLLAKTDQQLEQLEKLTSDVEFAAVQKDVMYGLQQGTMVLKQIHAEMGGIAGVEKLLEDSAEARAQEKEISDLLASGGLSNADEDEVEDELEALEKSLAPKQPESVPTMPDAPLGEVQAPQEEEESVTKETKARQRAKERRMEAVAA
jgi:charged multivesicular body protein 6